MALKNAQRLWVQMVETIFTSPRQKNRPEKVKKIVTVAPVEERSTGIVRREENTGSEKLSDLLDKYCTENSSRWDGTYEHKDVRPILGVRCEVTGDKSRVPLSVLKTLLNSMRFMRSCRRTVKKY